MATKVQAKADCPDCHGSGAILLLESTVPCACGEPRLDVDSVRGPEMTRLLEGARGAAAPEKLVPGADMPSVFKGLPARYTVSDYLGEHAEMPGDSGSLTINGVTLKADQPVWVYQSGVRIRVCLVGPGQVAVDVEAIDGGKQLARHEEIAAMLRDFCNRDSELILSDSAQAQRLIQGPEDYCVADRKVPIDLAGKSS